MLGVSAEALRFARVAFRSHGYLVAENLFLRKQLAFYRERNIKARRLPDSARFALLFWSHWFPWRIALVVVKPETLIVGTGQEPTPGTIQRGSGRWVT